MKLVVIFADTHMAYDTAYVTGTVVQAPKRKVEIELTEEQAKMLKPRKIGQLGKNVITEDILIMFFEEAE